ncbi:MAG: hypothetical protein IJT97_06255, partial [Bacteroidaceae bacterium]|nr:hypothetical protein [Bacteroidaceae bacterium]
MEFVFALVGVLVGFAIGYLFVRSQVTALQAKLDMTTVDNTQLIDEKERLIQTYTAQMAEQQSEYNRQEESLRTEASRQQEGMRSEYSRQIEMLRADYAKQLLDLREQQRQQLDQQLNLLREQMTAASEKVLKDRSEELSQVNQQQLAAILNPLRTEITQMKETVDKSGREHATSMERLDASIKANMEKANLLSERADRLANALIGD